MLQKNIKCKRAVGKRGKKIFLLEYSHLWCTAVLKKLANNWQAGRAEFPRPPTDMQWVPLALQHNHSKSKEEKPQDERWSWTFHWNFTSNRAKTPFIPILLWYNTVAMEFISQHYQTKIPFERISPKHSLVQMDIVSFLCRSSPKWNKIRDTAEVSPGSIHSWHSIFWQWESPSNSFCHPHPERLTLSHLNITSLWAALLIHESRCYKQSHHSVTAKDETAKSG